MTDEIERARFEKWANAKGTMGNSWNGEYYENKLHDAAWQSWQAALSSRGDAGTPKCDDCAKPIADNGICRTDEDGRTFHLHCGGAKFAKRMATVPGTPEFIRAEAALAQPGGQMNKPRATDENCNPSCRCGHAAFWHRMMGDKSCGECECKQFEDSCALAHREAPQDEDDVCAAEEIAGLLIVEGSEHNGLVNEIRTVLSRHMAPERSAWAERESAWQAEREQWKAWRDEIAASVSCGNFASIYKFLASSPQPIQDEGKGS